MTEPVPTENGNQLAQQALPSGNDPRLLAEVAGWNWGAFLFPLPWAFGHRLWTWGFVLLALLVIPCGQIGYLGLGIYLGVRGNEIAWRLRPSKDLDQFRAVELVWQNWAVGLMIATVVIAIIVRVAW